MERGSGISVKRFILNRFYPVKGMCKNNYVGIYVAYYVDIHSNITESLCAPGVFFAGSV